MFSLAGILAFFARPMVKSIAKYVGGALLIALAVWFAVHKWNAYKASIFEEGRQQGRSEVTLEYKKIVDSNDATNRRVEAKVGQSLDEFNAGIKKTLSHLSVNEQKVATTIIAKINANPAVFNNRTCDTPKDVMDARNAIRRMGPKE